MSGISSDELLPDMACTLKRKDPEPEADEVNSANGSGRRKSKRRSSFVRGRITQSQTLPVVSDKLSSKDLLQEISKDLPPDERLLELHKAALKFTLNKLGEEFADCDGMQQFQVEAMHFGKKKIHQMAAEGLFRQAIQENGCIPHPANMELQRAIDNIHQMSQRLKEEKQSWDNLVAERTEIATEAKRLASEANDNPITEPPSELSAAHQSVLDQRLDLNKIRANMRRTEDEVEIMVDQLVSGVNVIKTYFMAMDAKVKEQALLFHQHAFNGMEDFDNPKKLIQNLTNTS